MYTNPGLNLNPNNKTKQKNTQKFIFFIAYYA